MTEKRRIYAWALYDWANSAYATVIMAGFFPIFFHNFWNAGEDDAEITFRLGFANSLASVLIVFLAPVLGAIADRGGARKKFLFTFACLGVVMTGALFFVAEGHWAVAAALYVLSMVGFMGGNVFYDALLVSVAPKERYDAVSALGYALGYLGGGLLFLLCVLMTLRPGSFGLENAGHAVRISFLLTAGWWAVFTVPLLLHVREQREAVRVAARTAVREGFGQLVETFRHIRRQRMVFLFLLAYWLYIDGVDTIVRMAVNYGKQLGFGDNQLIVALLVTQFVGFPAAIVFGRLGERIGTRRAIFLAIGVYVLTTIWGARMERTWEFYALAVAIGLVQGGIQSLSRSYYARLIPPDKSAEFFGFYNMLGKFAAILGPILIGWIGKASGSPRIGILSILVLFVAGAAVLSRVHLEGPSSGD